MFNSAAVLLVIWRYNPEDFHKIRPRFCFYLWSALFQQYLFKVFTFSNYLCVQWLLAVRHARAGFILYTSTWGIHRKQSVCVIQRHSFVIVCHYNDNNGIDCPPARSSWINLWLIVVLNLLPASNQTCPIGENSDSYKTSECEAKTGMFRRNVNVP